MSIYNTRETGETKITPAGVKGGRPMELGFWREAGFGCAETGEESSTGFNVGKG